MARYIEAEALKKHFPHDEDWDCPVNTNSLVCELIDAQPAADVAPVKHGRWESVKVMDDDAEFGEADGAQCTECGHTEYSEYWAKTYFHYCPNCGAKMDESTMGQVKRRDAVNEEKNHEQRID